ncbi:DUF6153 family protein [Mumia flava]|nr:DUF6153 family protein [Mumia flava]
MTTPDAAQRHRHRALLRVLGLVAAIAGVLAMHGLSEHGAAHHALGAAPSATTTEHGAATASSAGGSPRTADHGRARTDARDAMHVVGSLDASGTAALAVAGLCLAVLAAFALRLVLRGTRGGLIGIAPIARRWAPMRPPGRRFRPPPCLYELSVLRT